MRTHLAFLFLLIIFQLSAQDYRYGKVSKEELSKERSAIDPEAAGEILYERAYTKLEISATDGRFYLTKEVEGRIKVYDKDNLPNKFLQQEVALYAPSSNKEKLLNFRGSTYNLENGKIEETKVRNSDIFKERKNKYWESEKFAFPAVQNGSVLEYKYTLTSPFTRDLGRWYFQQEIPVIRSEYFFQRPTFYMYSMDERGQFRGRVTSNTRKAHGWDFDNITTEHVYENIKPLLKEPFVFNPNNLKASVRYELMKFEHPGFISENYTTTWAQIGKDLMNDSSFGGQLKGNGFLDETVNSLTANISNPIEKMQAIFQHVKNNYTWNNFYSFRADSQIRNTFRDKSGNAADINLMLISMMQKAGLHAEPVVLSTVQNLMVNYTFPSVTNLDFVIACVEINNNLYLMDATEKYSDINMLPLRDLNHRGFRINNKGDVQEIQLTNTSLSTIKESLIVDLGGDGKASGRYTETKDQYFAMNDRMRQMADPKGFEESYLKNYSFDVENFKMDENQDKSSLRYSFQFTDVTAGDVMGNKMIINPLFFTQLKENVYKQETRSYPLEFGTSISKIKTIRINIPEGYKVESLPVDQHFLVEGNVAGYVYKIEEKPGHILLTSMYELGYSFLPANYYKPMKEFENKQINAENQDIVLVKL